MIMRTSGFLLLSVIFCLFICIGLTIFVDEAYQVDYHHALLGIPEAHNTFFHRPSTASRASLLYTISNRGIVGAVNPKDGAILWRQRLGEEGQNFTTKRFLRAAEGSDLVFGAVGGTVTAWDATDGRIGWGWQGTGNVKAFEVLEGESAVNELFLLSEEGGQGVVRRFSTGTGTVEWEYADPTGAVPHSLILTKGKLFYVSLHSAILKGFKVKTTELDPTTGKQVGQPDILGSESEIFSEDSILHAGKVGDSPTIIWSDKSFTTVKVVAILKKHMTNLNVPSNAGDTIETVTVHAPRNAAAQPHFLLHFQGRKSHWAQTCHLDPTTGATRKANELQSLTGKGAFATSNDGADVYFVRHTNSELSLVSSKSADSLSSWKIPLKSQAGVTDVRDVSHAVTEVVLRGGQKFSIRSALSLRSGDWELVRNGETLWTRPEGLTDIAAATFTNIPQRENLAQELAVEGQYNILLAYTHRLRRHIRDLGYLPLWTKEIYRNFRATFSGDEIPSSHLGSQGNKFGFSKMVVVATQRGRLAALDTGNSGRVIWNIQAVSAEVGSIWNVSSINVQGNSLLICAAEGDCLRVESSTGRSVGHQRGALFTGLGTLADVTDSRGQQAFIPVYTDGTFDTMHETVLEDGTIVVTRSDRNRLLGWTIIEGSATLAWQFVPFAGEISEVLHRPAHDPVASIGKALGDRNVLYKYLNPNIMLVTAIDTTKSIVAFYLLDSTSGALLYSTSHSDVDLGQSISSTISENFFAYSLFSKTRSQDSLQIDQQQLEGFQLVIAELYESPYHNDRGPLGSSSNFSSTQPVTANGDKTVDTPHVISQSFLISGPISHMSMISTSQGITPRSLLCVVPHLNALVAIPRHIIDPRRPVGRDPTTAEMEEGLFRYNAMLEFEPRWSLNHKREFMGLSNVVTKPSFLESTSLILAHGDVDIFGTRYSPIGGFDLLGKGFSKLQLLGTVAALGVGTYLLAPLVCTTKVRTNKANGT